MHLQIHGHLAVVSDMSNVEIKQKQEEAITRLNAMESGNADLTLAILSYLSALQLEEETRTVLDLVER